MARRFHAPGYFFIDPLARIEKLGPLMPEPRFLTTSQCEDIAGRFGTPVYVYDEAALKENARKVLDFPRPFGFTGRYAMKACSNAVILQVFHRMGLQMDASSGFEAHRAIRAGIPAENISLSSQELPKDFADLVGAGISINACSLKQLRAFGETLPGNRVGLRINPGVGSGSSHKTNVGGPSSSFGIWHELLPEAEEIIDRFDLEIFRIHTHIGSGSDPAVWQKSALLTLRQVERFPAVTHLNLGGGFKVGRMREEVTTGLPELGAPIKAALEDFARRTGRKLHLEIEPGTFLVANAGCLLASVEDKTTTGEDGHVFLKLDAGMSEILRPTLYAAQQPMTVIPRANEPHRDVESVIVVGHCCESGDLLTPDPSDPVRLKERKLLRAEIGDLFVIDGAGAYCSAMQAKNYNSFPETPEALLRESGELALIRKRQTLDQILQNEVPL